MSKVINYEIAKQLFPKQKAALTRALNTKDPERRKAAVLRACRSAVKAWNELFGAWPDDWSRWQRALDDQYRTFNAPRLEDL